MVVRPNAMKNNRYTRLAVHSFAETLASSVPQNHSNVLENVRLQRATGYCSTAADSGTESKSPTRFALAFNPRRFSTRSLAATLTGGVAISC